MARAALRELGDVAANSRAWVWAKHYELKRGDRSRGGASLYKEGRAPLLLEDGAPAHVQKLSWPGHSPDVNAAEHAWPWIRRHLARLSAIYLRAAVPDSVAV